ncbi:MAG TPA: hypothetical protein VFY29_06315 [Terriglobia bacterium]|nr:hypothetical protein [Terriglobia bacterium]
MMKTDPLELDRRTPWTIAGIVLCSAAAIAAAGGEIRAEIVCGMLGPLLAVGGTWILVESARNRPEALLGRMIAAFAVKMVFLGAYVAVMVKLVGVKPVPFAVSFAGYFVVFYWVEALHLKRVLQGGRPPAS